MVIVKARGAATALLPAMRAAVASVDPALPIYDAMTLDERIGAAVSRPRFNATLLASFAGAALLLAAIGVYGMLSYSVSSRMRDIGVRLALGADAGRVMTLVLRQGLRLAAIGAALGFVGVVRPRAARAEPAARCAGVGRATGRCRRPHHAGRVGRRRLRSRAPRQRRGSDDRAPERLNPSRAEFLHKMSTGACRALYIS